MKPLARVFEIPAYAFDSKRRSHRFRCQECMKLIADGESVMVERRKGGSHGYHVNCWNRAIEGDRFSSAGAALARAKAEGGS